jgi:hypothetical protein
MFITGQKGWKSAYRKYVGPTPRELDDDTEEEPVD